MMKQNYKLENIIFILLSLPSIILIFSLFYGQKCLLMEPVGAFSVFGNCVYEQHIEPYYTIYTALDKPYIFYPVLITGVAAFISLVVNIVKEFFKD